MNNQFLFEKAVAGQKYLDAIIAGVSGSGKTWTALTLATDLGGPIAVIDTERSSASLYADAFDFNTLQLSHYSIDNLESALKSAASAGFKVVIVDSFSHFWTGAGGILEEVDAWVERNKYKNRAANFQAWKEVGNPLVQRMIACVLDYPGHVICTARSKKKYLVGEDEKGKQKIEKGTLEPQVREGIEFEFDVVFEIDLEHKMIVDKTRCRRIDGKIYRKPKSGDFEDLIDWLNSGEPRKSPPPTTDTAAASELAVDKVSDDEIGATAKEIIETYDISKEALLVWVPRGLENMERLARLQRISRALADGLGKMSACAKGAYHHYLDTTGFGEVFTGKPEDEVAEHTALFKAINLYQSKENPAPLIDYIRAQFSKDAA